MRTPAVAIFVGVTLGSIPGDGHPQVVTGEQLLELCSPQVSDAAHAICFGYIMGSFDTSTIRGGICEPPTLTHRQLRDTAIKFMLNHPERLQEPAPHLIVASMTEAFPCR